MAHKTLTTAILVGGDSTRYGSEKSTTMFRGKPLVAHMISIARTISPRVILVTSSEDHMSSLREYAQGLEIAIDPEGSDRSALNGAVTAFEYSESEYTLLLPVDTPLANKGLLMALVQLCEGHGAVVPSWPNGFVEPLHAVYLTEHAYSRGLHVIDEGKMRMQDLLDSLRNVLYVQTDVLRRFDPNLDTFANINTIQDLKKLERR
ncbi:MAG: molybdenum cofactor guanylyltransferase [Candidatus Thorarchaeota archaeon]